MGIYLNKGNDAFKKGLSRRIYVDKSMLISKTNHAIEHDDSFWCVTRLRSSGKSYTALSFLWKSKVYPIGTGRKIVSVVRKRHTDGSFRNPYDIA